MQVESSLSGCSVNETVTGPGSYHLPLPAPTHSGQDGAGPSGAVEQPVNEGSSSGRYEAGTTAYWSTATNLTCLGEKRYDAPTKVGDRRFLTTRDLYDHVFVCILTISNQPFEVAFQRVSAYIQDRTGDPAKKKQLRVISCSIRRNYCFGSYLPPKHSPLSLA